MNKKSNLKKFFATASAVAMITGVSSSAVGDQFKTDGHGAATIQDGQPVINAEPHIHGGRNNWNAGDSFYFVHGQDLVINGATVATIDINNINNRNIRIANNSSISSIINSTGAQVATLVVNDGKVLTLDGKAGVNALGVNQAPGTFTHFGNITLGSGAGGSELVINLDSTLTGNIDSDNAQDGRITVNAGKTAEFDGVIGETKKLGQIQLDGANSEATFNKNVTADQLNLNDATAVATIGNGVTFTGEVVATNGDNEGKLIFSGSGVVTGDIGENFLVLNLIELTGDKNSDVHLQGNVAATTTEIGAGTLKLADTKTITGNVEAKVRNTGTLYFDKAGTVTGTIGATTSLGNIVVAGAGNVDFQDAVKTKTLQVSDAGSNVDFRGYFTGELQFSADGQATVDTGDLKVTGNVKNTVAAGGDGKFANTGKLIFTSGAGANNADGAVTGAIGEDGKALSLVQITGAGDIHLQSPDTSHYAAEFKFNDADARLIVANGGKLIGNLAANNDGDGKVRFAGAGEIKGTIGNKSGSGFGLVEANGAGVVSIGAGDHKATFEATNNDSSFKFADAANITGAITNNSGAVGNTALTFEGSSIVAGAVGDGVNKFKTIDVTGKADQTVTFEGVTKATKLNIGKADQEGAATVRLAGNLDAEVAFLDNKTQTGELEIFGTAAHNITGDINKNIGTNESRGKIIIASNIGTNAVTFKGQIGDTANKKSINHLHILNNNAGGSVVLEGGDVHIGKIQAAGKGSLKLNEADAKYKFGEIVVDADNVFALEVDENAVLEAPEEGSVNFGSENKRLSEVQFNANKSLTIENGVNIYAAKLNEHGVNNNGTLIFKGDSIFSAESGGKSINEIKVQDGGTVKLLKSIKTNGNIELSDNTTLELSGNVKSADIKGTNAGQGKLRFTNDDADTEVDSTIGAGNKLHSIEFAGGNVRFKNAVTHTGQEFKFTGKNESIITFDKAGFGDANFVNASESNGVGHTILLKNNEIFTGNNIAVENAATKQISFDIGSNNNVATLQGGVQADGARFINGGDSGKGTLDLNAAGVKVYSAGTDSKRLDTITFQENATITNGASANKIAIQQNKTAKMGGEISGTNFNLENVGSTVEFLDGATLKVAVADTVGSKGIIRFQGGGTVEADKTIGTDGKRVKIVDFSDDASKTLTFGSKVFAAEKIDIRKGTFKAGNNNVVLNAQDVNARNASFDLGSSGKITVNGGNLTFSGEEGKIAVAIEQYGNKVSGGQIVADVGSTLKYEEGSKVTITPDDSGIKRLSAGESSEFAIIKNNTGKDVVGKLNVAFNEAKNSFTKWSSRFENGTLILTQKDGAADKIKEILGKRLDGSDKRNIDSLTKGAPGTDAHNFVNTLQEIARNEGGNLSDADIENKIDEVNNRLVSTTAATDSVKNTMSNAANSIGTRLSLVSNQTIGTPVQSRAVASAKVTGIASGDDHARYGAWFSPFFSKTTQKARKGASGYRDSTYGGSFGMDTRANDDLIIGGAMTFANSETKYKNLKSGDKTKVNSLMFSIYGLQQITDNWFAQGSATIASNEVKNSVKKGTGVTSYELANSKYNAMSFVGDVLFGYNYITEGFSLTPMGGVRYTRVNSAGYKESGSTQNLDVSQKASNRFEVIVGGRVSGGAFDVNGMSVTPELHGFINHDIIGKTPKQDLRIDGAALNAKSIKPIKTSYNLGVGITANYGMMEYGAGYDVHLADKRVGHEGSLKVRVNF